MAPELIGAGATQVSSPVKVVSTLDGKPSTATHISLGSGKNGANVPIEVSKPIEIAKGSETSAPVTVVQAKPSAMFTDKGQKAVATFVGDGDGGDFKLADGSHVTCRLEASDAPEVPHPKRNKVGQPGGEAATTAFKNLLDSGQITVQVVKAQDNYGRSVCRISVEGKNVDLSMIESGASMLYRRYSMDPKLLAAEKNAYQNKLGQWANPLAEYPELFKRRMGY